MTKAACQLHVCFCSTSLCKLGNFIHSSMWNAVGRGKLKTKRQYILRLWDEQAQLPPQHLCIRLRSHETNAENCKWDLEDR